MLHALGLTSELAGYATTADSRLGRVLGVSTGLVTVLTEDGPLLTGLGGGLLRAVAADPEQAPCPGDWVLMRDWPDHRVTLERVLPRHSSLRRGHAGGPVAAANVDVVGVVVPAGPEPGQTWLARTLARAEASGAAQVLVLCRTGRAADPSTAPGVLRLRELVAGRTLALVGGRTADRAVLCRALAGPHVARPWPRLLPLSGGGAVLDADTPAPAPPPPG